MTHMAMEDTVRGSSAWFCWQWKCDIIMVYGAMWDVTLELFIRCVEKDYEPMMRPRCSPGIDPLQSP